MELWVFMLLVLLGSLAAGFLGSLTGLGGGIIVTPMLVLLLGVDLRYAIGAALIAVIATSCGSAGAFLRQGFVNVRVAMVLEVATVAGALLGAYIAGLVDKRTIAIIFSLVLLWTAWNSLRPPPLSAGDPSPDALGSRLGLHGTYPGKAADGAPASIAYNVHQVPAGLAVMFAAGVLSALVGIGSGIVKVLAMDRLMKLPFKVSTTTSNFMIGVTAAASAGVYFHRGQIEPAIAAPVALGALAGSMAGARVLPRIKTDVLRKVFAVVVVVAGVQLGYRAISGTL